MSKMLKSISIFYYTHVCSHVSFNVIVNINILFVCIYEMVVKNYSKFVLKIHIRSICNKIRVRKFNVNFFKIKPYVLLKMFFEVVRFKLTYLNEEQVKLIITCSKDHLHRLVYGGKVAEKNVINHIFHFVYENNFKIR